MNVMDSRATSALLYLDGVHVSFDGFHAINNLSLTLAPGEMRAIIGPNGAGKTTMMDIITGKTKPDEGEVLFDGVTDLTRLDETRIAELGIGRKFQKPTVFESQTSRGQSAAGAQCRPQRQGHAVLARQQARERAHREGAGNHPPDGRAQPPGRQPVARPEAMAGDRHAAGAGSEAAAGRRARRRHDRRRDPSDRRAAEGNQQGKDRDGRRARHDLRPRARRQGDRACTKARCWPKAPSIRCRRTSA